MSTDPHLDVVPRDEEPRTTSSWSPLDLAGVLRGDLPPETPTRLHLTDGRALLYPGRLHSLVGEPSGGKTWVAAHAAAEALTSGDDVVVIDLEDSARLWVERLRRLDVPDADIAEGLHYVRPLERLTSAGAADLRPSLDLAPGLVVVDAFTGLLALEGADPNSSQDVERTYRRVLRPLRDCGAAVLVLDHVTKSRESRGRWATGSERKLSAIDGAGYVLDVKRAFGRGRRGLAQLVIAKDRLGVVGTPGDIVAEIHLDDTQGTDHIDIRLTAPTTSDPGTPWRPTVLMARVSAHLEAHGAPLSRNQLEKSITGKASAVRDAIDALIEDGYATSTPGARNAVLIHHVALYTQPQDTP